MTMDGSRQESLEKLDRFASQLRKLTFPTSPISIDLARFVAAAIDRCLHGDEKSLDAAFGLTAKRGAPRRQDDEHEKLARRVFTLRELDDKSWKEIVNTISEEGWAITDERTIRRIYDEFGVRLILEKIDAEWEGHK